MNEECCYTCIYYKDALCVLGDEFDDESPDTFSCDEYEYYSED